MDKSLRDLRLPKQFGDFAEQLVMFILGQTKNMSVAYIDHVGADLIAVERDKKESENKRFAISVKGRIIPEEESKTYGLDQDNIDKLNETAGFLNMEPAVAFVLVDEQEQATKIRILIGHLKSFIALAEEESCEFITKAKSGFNIRFNINKGYIEEIQKSEFFDYLEIAFPGKFLSNIEKKSKFIKYWEK